LVIKELPDPEPKAGHVVIQIKAFGINHAEMHMRRGEWAEAAEVSGIECVGLVKSCPGSEFAIGTKVAALMGGMGRTINGSYAEYTRPTRDKRRADRVGPSLGTTRRDPGILRHGLDMPVPQPGSRRGPDFGHPRGNVVVWASGSEHGGERWRSRHCNGA
jgi:hypothetical protein